MYAVVFRRGSISAAAVGVVALTVASVGNTQIPADEAEGIIFERQQIMLQLEKDSETLGMIAAGLAPPDKLAATTRSIAQSAKGSLTAFEPMAPGGRSKAEVWSKRADFMRRMQEFADKTEEMAEAAESGKTNAVAEMMVGALSCKTCHDAYREKKRRHSPMDL